MSTALEYLLWGIGALVIGVLGLIFPPRGGKGEMGVLLCLFFGVFLLIMALIEAL